MTWLIEAAVTGVVLVVAAWLIDRGSRFLERRETRRFGR